MKFLGENEVSICMGLKFDKGNPIETAENLMRVTNENAQSGRGNKASILENLKSHWPGGPLTPTFPEENK